MLVNKNNGNTYASKQKSFYKTWSKMRDAFKGEDRIKERALQQNQYNLDGQDQLKPLRTFDQYIRPTDSMRRLGALGLQRFCDYIFRAKFYPFPLQTKMQSLGMIENQPPKIELPEAMEGMLKSATIFGDSLEKVLATINGEQLEVSKVGILLSPSNEDFKPFNISFYKAETILDLQENKNFKRDVSLNWVKLLTEELSSDLKPVYLILSLDENGLYSQYKTTNENAKAEDLFFEDPGYIENSYVEPLAYETRFDEIPFVIVNLTSLGSKFEKPYLESLVDASLSLFRASAHHEDALYWGGESTLFTKGFGTGPSNTQDGSDKVFVGNGAVNKTNAEYADAKYVTMGVDGITPRKQNEDKLFDFCVSLSVDLINKGSESGTALNIRTDVKTASLKTLSLTGALGLQKLLRYGAKWLGLNEDDVAIKANTVFADVAYTADDFVKFADMVATGSMREQDLFLLQKKNNLTSSETFEDWSNDMVDN